MRPFYSFPYPPCFFMGGCDLGWEFRPVFFRLIRIPRTVHEWRLRIFAFNSMRVWGWLTLMVCASTTGAVTFSKVTWHSLIWNAWLSDYGCQTIFLRTNKFSQIFLVIVISGVILKRNYWLLPLSILGVPRGLIRLRKDLWPRSSIW